MTIIIKNKKRSQKDLKILLEKNHKNDPAVTSKLNEILTGAIGTGKWTLGISIAEIVGKLVNRG